jgi:hypothetical protein
MESPRKSGRSKWLLTLVILPLLLFAAYTWFVLTWSYSRGERAGYVQKLSQRGWLCKTWEGEIALVTIPGTVAEKFEFSVRSDDVAAKINTAMGQRVTLDYEQHVGVPSSCFGDTAYFVTGVRVVADPATPAPAPAPTALPPPAAAPAPATAPAPAADTTPAPTPAPAPTER